MNQPAFALADVFQAATFAAARFALNFSRNSGRAFAVADDTAAAQDSDVTVAAGGAGNDGHVIVNDDAPPQIRLIEQRAVRVVDVGNQAQLDKTLIWHAVHCNGHQAVEPVTQRKAGVNDDIS